MGCSSGQFLVGLFTCVDLSALVLLLASPASSVSCSYQHSSGFSSPHWVMLSSQMSSSSLVDPLHDGAHHPWLPHRHLLLSYWNLSPTTGFLPACPAAPGEY